MKHSALFKATAVPEETHPDAMTAWLVAQTLYHGRGTPPHPRSVHLRPVDVLPVRNMQDQNVVPKDDVDQTVVPDPELSQSGKLSLQDGKRIRPFRKLFIDLIQNALSHSFRNLRKVFLDGLFICDVKTQARPS